MLPNLVDAINHLIELGLLLAVQVMRKILPSNEDGHPADDIASDAIYDFLRQGRNRLVVALGSATVNECHTEYTRLVIQVNTWIARKRLDGVDSIREEVTAWQVAALKPRFSLARLALLGCTKEAHELGQRLLASSEITQHDWDTWPLLADVRDYEESRKAEGGTAGDQPA